MSNTSDKTFSGKVTWDFVGDASPVEQKKTVAGFMRAIDFYTKIGLPTTDALLINVDSMSSLYGELTKYQCAFDQASLPSRAGFFIPYTCDGGHGVVTAFIWDVDKWPVDGYEFQTILEHEYFHQIQQGVTQNHFGNGNFPRWFWEGGAVFFSGLAFASYNPQKYYEQHLLDYYTGPIYRDVFDAPCRQVTIDQLSDVSTPFPAQACDYSKGSMIVEFLVSKFGVQGYLDILRDNVNPDWRNFGTVFEQVTHEKLTDFYNEANIFLMSRGWN